MSVMDVIQCIDLEETNDFKIIGIDDYNENGNSSETTTHFIVFDKKTFDYEDFYFKI